MALRISGETGQVKVGYQQAAELGPWHLVYGRTEESPEGERVQAWNLKTTARDVNVVWLSRGVYDLVLPFGLGADGRQQYAKFKNVRIDWPDCQCEFTIRGDGRPEIS